MAGTGSTSSSMTSTSHTLTHAPGMLPTASSSDVAARQYFLDSLRPANRHRFLRPDPSTPSHSLEFVRETLDAFAGQVSDGQQQRLRDAHRKRKRADIDRSDVLKIRKLHIDGFETAQVWQQAKRIISSALSESQALLQELQENGDLETEPREKAPPQLVEFGKDGFEVGSEDESDASRSSNSESDNDEDDENDQDIASDVSNELQVSGEESESESEFDQEVDERASQGDEDVEEGEKMKDDDDDDDDSFDNNGPNQEYIEDPHGLNDGFFSIDDFNKQTQWFEDQDARADPNTDVVSDEEDLDWHQDPMAPAPKSKATSSKPRRGPLKRNDVGSDLENDDDGDDDDHGPTFGDMDLDAPDGASDDEFGENIDKANGDSELTADDIFYKDFFAPPPKKAKKGGDRRKEPYRPKQPKDYDVEAAMEGVKRDLFEDDSEGSRSGLEDDLSEVEAGDPKARKSAHERRQAKITEEIRKLEAALVKPKDWTLAGEAAAPERPINSLLEEDLDFEHVGKPVPVITEEVSESIEEMIKRRIIAQEFDEVIRRVPGSDLAANGRRGLVELDDTKAKQGLAGIYEEEYVKNANPDSYVSQSDEKLRREEKEIEQMWKEVSAKLDSLSSWHFKPKPAAPSLTVVSDVATVAMEDAQPTTAQGVNGGASMMAPQEVYKAAKETAEVGEVVPKSGLPVARQEMTREEKLRRRRREKERMRKAGEGSGGRKKPLGKKAQERNETMSDLRKGGVMVINKQGEIMDVDGNKPKANQAASSGNFKL